MNIAIVGATGNVGRKTLEVLEKKGLSIDNLYLVASSKSVGKKISFKGKDHEVFDLESFDFPSQQSPDRLFQGRGADHVFHHFLNRVREGDILSLGLHAEQGGNALH